MAGNFGSPENQNPNPNQNPEPVVQKPKKPRVKTFSCPKCGGNVTVRYPGQSLSAVCDSCKSVIDVTNDNYQIISRTYANMQQHEPRFELGTRGKLRGRLWEIIGYMVRCDVASRYHWEEYLLFNPYYGFRWLTYAQGSWNFVIPTKEKPSISGSSYDKGIFGGERASLADGNEFRLFYRGDAEVVYVLGEFYWKVIVQSRVRMCDYVAPPLMLSSEIDGREVNWSVSEYIANDEIVEAFKPTRPTPRTYYIAPNQLTAANKTWKALKQYWIVFAVALTALQFVHLYQSPNRTVYAGSFPFNLNAKLPDLTTPVFNVAGPTNVQVMFNAPVDNSWLYIGGDLVNDETNQTYSFERTCEYYHGWDSDGSWTEGSQYQSMGISSVPSGNFYINMDTESGDFKNALAGQREFSVIVKTGVPTWSNYLWALFLVSFLPGMAMILNHSDEVARWRDSDFSPYFSSE